MKVLVGLSGGVDSAVSALLLKQAGYEVIGATMRLFDDKQVFKEDVRGCFSAHQASDIETAEQLCHQLGIEYHTIDCVDIYRQLVLDNFKSEYLSGRTPNPCIQCNSKVKFNALPMGAKRAGIEFDKFATGHYARIIQKSGIYFVQAGVDEKKDQSYFLYRLTQEQLSNVLFPLGEYEKSQVRKIAEENQLIVSHKPDSQDFYTGDLNDILQQSDKKGDFVDETGKVWGHHNGFWHYTIGQRKGLGIAAPEPLYVLGFNMEKNQVILGFADKNVCSQIKAAQLVFNGNIPTHCLARIRSSQKLTSVYVKQSGQDEITIDFEVIQRGIASGQSVVLYDENKVVFGGGIIL